MKFRILGDLEAEADGVRLPLGGPSEQKTLAVLLLDANRVVPVARLVDGLWDDAPPGTAVKQARNAVSRLRRLFAGAGAADPVMTVGGGYRLRAGAGELDARRFEDMAGQAERCASVGRPAEAVTLLRSALGLWRGPFLCGLDGRVIEAAAAAWNERRCRIQELYFDHQLALGRHQDVVGELTALVMDQPLREKPAGQLMLALYRCGRQSDALTLYTRMRKLLDEELGLAPGPALQELHRQILTADAALAAPAPAGQVPTVLPQQAPAAGRGAGDPARDGPWVVPRQLPGAVRHFAGRRDELKSLAGLLGQTSGSAGAVVISAIGGTAGIGKTALAVHWAHQVADRFPDGQLYLDLHGFAPAGQPTPPASAIRCFLDAFGVPPERLPASPQAQEGLYRSLLAGKRVLVLLDNARDVAQVRPLLPGEPGCLVVVTSRSQLTGLVVADEAVPLSLDLLPPEEARDLLVQRLGAERLAAEAEAVAELITLCARLPLALSIVAARAAIRPDRPLAALAAELRDVHGRLDVLDAGDAASDIRAVFSWSYARLAAPAARMFRLAGLHPGADITPAAAASLAGVSLASARESLAELTRANLLAEHTHGRFTCHDLLRAYAAERAGSEEDQAARHAAMHRLLDHYLYTAHAASLLINPARDPLDLEPCQPGVTQDQLADHEQALAWFEAEHDALLAAIDQAAAAGFDAHAWRLPWALQNYLDRRGHWHDWARTQRTALAAATRLGDLAAQATAHDSLGYACARLGSTQDGHAHSSAALGLYERLGNSTGQARVHLDIGRLLSQEGRHDEAIAHARLALDLYRNAGHRAGQAIALHAIGWCQAHSGGHRDAVACCQQAIGIFSELDEGVSEAAAWDSLGFAHHQMGQHAEAICAYHRSIGLCRQITERHGEAIALGHLGDTHRAAGDADAARDAWRQALAILEELQAPDAEQIRARLQQTGRT